MQLSTGPGRTRAQPRGLLIIPVLAVFSAAAPPQPRQASPERVGEYRQTQSFYRAPWKSVKQNALRRTLAPANVAKYYATGPHTFFDIAPLKYGSWDDYEKGVRASWPATRAPDSPSTTTPQFTPKAMWSGPPLLSKEMTTKAGRVEMGIFRWTGVWENEDGKWLIVHEHVSAPIQ